MEKLLFASFKEKKPMGEEFSGSLPCDPKNSQENTCARVSFLFEQFLCSYFYLYFLNFVYKETSGTCAFLWILRNFQNTFFQRTFPVAGSRDFCKNSFYKQLGLVTILSSSFQGLWVKAYLLCPFPWFVKHTKT